ncbi:hypothetical protein QLX08_003712 [Tetragonisca angustula]|uniref:Transposase n=1 Tax=Tetragonisca angustula TaxID=166442 RepID=A0AAW1A864_9HYME
MFPETERKDRKKVKQKFVKCSSSRLSYCKQALLKYIRKYNTNPQIHRAVRINSIRFRDYLSNFKRINGKYSRVSIIE